MKQLNQKTKTYKILAVLTAIVTALGLTAFSPVAPVLAQSTASGEHPQQQDFRKLEEIYQREQSALAKLAGFLSNGETAIGKVEGLIDRGSSNGLDTSALSAALSEFEPSLASAQNEYGSAASILASHTGFNGSGKVLDRDEAVQTLKEAGTALKRAGSILKDAGSSLKAAVQSWVQTNKGAVTDKLSQLYQKAEEWLGIQDTNIGKLNDAAGKIQIFIDKARERGEDTSSLEKVVSDIHAQLPQSQSYHHAAASVLASHAGFDASGNVTDAAVAKSTLESAKSNLENSKNINISLAAEIKAAVNAWKVTHPVSDGVPDVSAD